MSKIAIVLDTQIAHSPDKNCSFDKFHIFEYDNTVDFIERHDLLEEIEVFIPEIVLNEIVEHRIRKLESDLSQLGNLRDRFSLSGICDISDTEEDFNRVEYIEVLKERRLKQLNVIPIPKDRFCLFNDILEKSLKKYPPFKQGKSDQGFKDAIILSSIIEFFKGKEECEKIFLFSNDNGFSLVSIEEIYSKEKIKLEIIQDIGVQNFLISKFGLKIELKEYLDGGFFSEEIDQIIDVKIKNEEKIIKLINDYYKVLDVTTEKYYINEISDNECEVNFYIIVNMKKGSEKLEIESNLKLVFNKNIDKTWEIKDLENNE